MSSNVVTAVVPLEKPVQDQPEKNSPVVDTPQNQTPSPVPPANPEGTSQPEVPSEAPKAETEGTEPSAIIQELISAANEELATTGKLSEESRQKLAEASGLPKEFVELTYEGMVVRQQRINNELLSLAGGQEAYLEMVKWATSAYSSDQAKDFNDALKSGDLTKAKDAVVALRTKFTEVNGSPKALQTKAASLNTPVPSGAKVAQTATQPQTPEVKPFASFNDMAEAMRDKRYGKDTEYTKEVYRRAHLSNF